MKKNLFLILTILMVFNLAGCSIIKNDGATSNESPYSYEEDVFEENYTGYYVEYDNEDEVVNITNYDPTGNTYPTKQELIQYGYCGLHSEGLIYFIYIMDSNSYCYLEMDTITLEILYEDNNMFEEDGEMMSEVNDLIEMMDFVIKSE